MAKDLRILIGIPSPRDIPQFIESTKLLTRYDKYWVKYRPENESYPLIRKKFLECSYDYLAILSDDLVVTQSHIDQLIADIEADDYPIISGLCSVDARQVNYGKYCVSKEFPKLDNLTQESYKWLEDWEREKWIRLGIPIIQVKHNGFPLIFIRRDIVEQIPFKPLARYGCCTDVQYCLDCYAANVPIFVDLRVVGNHLKKADGIYDNWGLASKNPVVRFEPKTKD